MGRRLSCGPNLTWRRLGLASEIGPLAPGISVSDRNRIEMALLGRTFGMPSAALTIFGSDSQKLALVNNFGLMDWDLAGAARRSFDGFVENGVLR